MSIAEKSMLTINVLVVVYFAFVAGMRYERWRAAAALQTDGEPK